ncbi:archaellin/type IV pilin N-terminal domain-containing protein [Methanofollis tationis]|uniref:Flagellin n=1 Tax=Methanofollis tationis TaxID=81417 RepID=A0A7K4HMF1_9EURY|nr:archaellin/type IV pilin N-terminal domain-containing protein [Methanofollis tationis]NVO66369.1 flagellin [Methanofollis tationis]
MKQYRKNDEAFTGLEAAIVLIAFVVVAAVFSYVMLGAGFFTSQKSQEVVHTSVVQASSSMEIRGDVYGLKNSTTGDISAIQFTVALTAGGSPVDINKTVLTYMTADVVSTLNRTATSVSTTEGNWTVSEKQNADTDWLLDSGEQFVIKAYLPTNYYLPANMPFSIEIRPDVGAALGLKRTVPAQIDAVNLLY